MRALVTGATGFIGWHVARALREAGHSVRALVRNPAWAARRLEPLGIEWVVGDLAQPERWAPALEGVDAVFHVAALYSLAQRDAAAMLRVNVEGTRRLLAAALAHGVRRVVYTSSTAAVGLRPGGEPADETDWADPDRAPGAYKRSKILAEQAALQAARSGLDVVVVNPSAPIGWGDIKPTPTGKIILDAVAGRMPYYVETGLNWVAVEDVAQGHLLAFERGRPGERYILGNANLSLREILERIQRILGRRGPLVQIPWGLAAAAGWADEFILSPLFRRPPAIPWDGVRLARRPMYFSAAKAVRELGLPQTPIDQALEAAVRWFREEWPRWRTEVR
ncbi:MAG: NAD-dependent epimerase/dehydratase family protein [Firmicutes bacterium]|nr:NAD-dependent epimerase/dehydratase family protein [Alicyclobacillaceae bacterium]MCL6498076.1 NAD-dependent epimerase/dehydratase family protein [Bacillota bacterium]